MGLKDYIAMVAASGSLVFGWIASQDQLCDMRLAQPICMAPPIAAGPTPASASAPTGAAPQATDALPGPVPASVPASPPTALPPAAAQTPPVQSPLATGEDLSGAVSQTSTVPQAALSSEQAAQFEQRVREYLDVSAQNNAAGFRARLNDTVVAMQPSVSHSVEVTLNTGVRYRVLGACDDDCSAIALEAYDPNGALITRSDGSGDFPVLELTPTRGGQYTMRVRLNQCRIAPCFVGVRVMER